MAVVDHFDNAKNATKSSKTGKKLWGIIIDYALIAIGTVIFAYGVHAFTAPNGIAPGGMTGVAIIVNSLTTLNVGVLFGLVNIPLVILGFIFLNKKVMLKTLFSVALFTFVIDYILAPMPVYQGEGILASIFGGLLMGFGLGVVYFREGTTGGTDIINRIILRFFPHFKIGQITFATDAVIILTAMLVFQDINAGLYAIIVIFVQAQVIDRLVYGTNEAKMLMIFTDKHDEISKQIMKTGRGVTFLQGTGAFSNAEKKVLYTIIYKNQYFKIKRTVKQIDPYAFLVVSSVSEVLGQGFKGLD